jgi:hypothetical protein
MTTNATRTRKPSEFRSAGSAIVWPLGVEQRYDISAATRLRWERLGVLPRRDVFIAGVPKGWKPSTLEAADSGNLAITA